MGYQWQGFRKVRNQVCKRIRLRIESLGLAGFSGYKHYLASHEEEWDMLDGLCYVTISRFYRDRKIFYALESRILPALAEKAAGRKRPEIRCWSAGCCSGEEPYTLKIIWREICQRNGPPGVSFSIVATERHADLIARARTGFYTAGSLKELESGLISRAFVREKGGFRLKNDYKDGILFLEQDIRDETPDGRFDLILCRNLVLTYFGQAIQNRILTKMIKKIRPGGFLLIGAHESLPWETRMLSNDQINRCVYQRRSS